MGSILQPGYLRWDGFKYILDPNINVASVFNKTFYVYFNGLTFVKVNF